MCRVSKDAPSDLPRNRDLEPLAALDPLQLSLVETIGAGFGRNGAAGHLGLAAKIERAERPMRRLARHPQAMIVLELGERDARAVPHDAVEGTLIIAKLAQPPLYVVRLDVGIRHRRRA